MFDKTKISIIFLFAIFVCVAIYIFQMLVGYFGYGFQTYALTALLICVGAVFISLIVDFTVTLPLKDFEKKLQDEWNEKKALPDSRELPQNITSLLVVFSAIIDDVQKKVKALGELKQLDDAKYEFIAIANHQLRTPITEIGWAVSALRELSGASQGNDTRDLIEKIENGVSRITTIVNQFLAVAELSANKPVESHITVDIADIVKKSVEQAVPIAKQKNMAIELEIEKNILPIVVGDPRLFGFIFETILTNAYFYGDAGTPIIVHLKNVGGMVEVEVLNEGVRLTPEEFPMLFEKFFRGHEAKRIRPDGSGLALYLSKRIIDQYSGTITVRMEAPKNICFVVKIPLASKGEFGQIVGNY